jgi:nitronate monooxygenase
MTTFALEQLRHPIVQAPMAGGPSTPELALAVCEAGGLGFVAAGYKRAVSVREEIAVVRAGTDGPFGVNLFVPTASPADPAAVGRYVERLAAEAARRGVELGPPKFDDDDWDAKLELVCAERPAVASFTFGCPPAATIERVRAAGVCAWVTVTSEREAVRARDAGADALVVQGTEAGGHRGGFVDDDEHAGGSGLVALLRLVARSVDVPLIATRGIADGAAVAAVLCAGAAAAQIGTALMLAPEAGTNPAQRALMREPIATGLTRAFSGRLARGMMNRFQAEHSPAAPIAYPEIHHVTSPLRAAARRSGDADGFNLWAGQAHELAVELPAAAIVERMASEARATLRAVTARFAQENG